MRLAITGRQVEITPGIRQLIEKRLAKLERILNDRALSAVITLATEKYRHVAELAVHAKGDHLLTSVGHGTTWPLSIRVGNRARGAGGGPALTTPLRSNLPP